MIPPHNIYQIYHSLSARWLHSTKIKGTTGILRYPALMESGRRGFENVRMKVFVGTNSLFRRIWILLTADTPWEERLSSISSSLTPSKSLLTADTPWEERLSSISSSLTPSKSLDRMTPFDELRDVCALTLIGILHITLDFRRHFEWCCLIHSTSKQPFCILFTLFRLGVLYELWKETENLMLLHL